MKHLNPLIKNATKPIAITLLLVGLNAASATELAPLIDNFDDQSQSTLGINRIHIDDSSAGGNTQAIHIVKSGVMIKKGELIPLQGQPGWSSTVLLLHPHGTPQDASAYQGVRLRVKATAGNLSVLANSSEIANFDYHGTHLTLQADGEFHEIEIPFNLMKRSWSEQTPLNTKTITGISLVAAGLEQGAFNFEIDEVGFY